MEADEDKRVFAEIRPYCVKLSQLALAPPGVFDPNSTDVSVALREVYTHLKDSLVENTVLSTGLADYVFMPLSYLLRHPTLGDTQTTYLLRILSLLIRHCWTTKSTLPYVMARQLFPLVTFLTGGPPNAKGATEINTKSEELKRAGSEALNNMFNSLAVQKEAKIYDMFGNVENLPALGHSVTVLLEFAHRGESIELQLAALNALHTLYFDVIHDGEIISYIIPGNVSTLTKIIATTGSKTHYSVIVKSLQLIRLLLEVVYDDNELQAEMKTGEVLEEIIEDPQLLQIRITEQEFRKVHRTNSWLKATSAQVKLAFQNIKKIHNHSRFEVRQELATLASSIVSHSLLTLSSSIPIAVEILALLSNDKSVVLEDHVLEPQQAEEKKLIESIISKELDSYVDTLTSVIQSPNEERILASISVINFTAKRSSDAFLMNKLVNSCVLEISESLRNTKQKHVLSSSSEMDDLVLISDDASKLTVDRKQLTVFDKVMTPQVQVGLAELFQSIAETRNPSDVIEGLLSEDYQTLNEKSVALWVANNLMQGYVSKVSPNLLASQFLSFSEDDDDFENIVSLQKPEFVYSILEFSKGLLDELAEMSPSDSVVQANSIALDTIGVVQHLMKEEFKPELIDYLYPVIDSMASPSDVVRQHAINTSMIIADNLYGGSLNDMILDNADYLIDAISVRLSNAMTTRATAILAVCTKIAGFEIINTFNDLMEILFSLIDNYHGYEDICLGFFLLFEIIADEIKKKYVSDLGRSKIESFDSTSFYAPWGLENVKQLVSLLDKKNRELSHVTEAPLEEDVEDEINKPDSDDEDEEILEQASDVKKEWSSPVPEDAYKLLQQIVYYGERLLTHPSTRLRIQILRTYKKVLPILATAPDNLLPIVASIWAVVSSLVNSADPKVVLIASNVLEEIIRYSGTFVTKRFLTFWETLKSSPLLVNATKQTSRQQKVVLPGLELKCYNSIVSMLVTSLNIMGRSLPDSFTESIIRSCIGVVSCDTFEQHSDMAWCLKREIYGVTENSCSTRVKQKAFLIDGETYELV